MPRVDTCDVLVVGAGPVGLTLATWLGLRGVDVAVVERRDLAEPSGIKANHVSARTMEIFRRLGVADAVRAAGLPDDYPHDVAFRTTTTGIEFARTPIPSRRARRTSEPQGPDAGWPTPEPAHRVNQQYLEPVLAQRVRDLETVRVLDRCEVVAVGQDGSGAWADVCDDREPGATRTIRCRFLVGCDGGTSLVRKTIGATLEGTPEVSLWQSTYFRSPQLLQRLAAPPAWMTVSVNPRQCGTVIAVDGVERWLLHVRLDGNGRRRQVLDRDAMLRATLGVGEDFEYELLGIEDWTGRRLVADRFRRDRVFICGDAAHLWVPFSGYGMNAGIADAEDLAWMLTAELKGWGGRRLLDAYEAERAPITEQVSQMATALSLASARLDEEVPAAIEEQGAEGEAVRREFGARAEHLSLQRHTAGGLNFGYFYDGSPVIAYDGAEPPAYGAFEFAQSTVPGCRMPHLWLEPGRSLYDELDEGFCLIRLDPALSTSGLEAAAERRGVPFAVVDVGPVPGAEVYDRGLVLSRPDAHVAWRGDREPADPGALLDLVRGEVSA